MELLRSAQLSSLHAFTTRDGGVSTGPYASLNVGINTQDEPAKVEQNLRLLKRELKLSALSTLLQVHGATVREAPCAQLEGDALYTSTKGHAVGVRVADCIPLLWEDRATGRVGATHAGWRGVDLEIARLAIEQSGSRPDDVVCAVGPHIRVCCFEVGEDLAVRFAAKFGESVVDRTHDKPHLDLAACVGQTLRTFGVERIDVLPGCTSCEPRFFSHRRDRGVTGRHLGLICATNL